MRNVHGVLIMTLKEIFGADNSSPSQADNDLLVIVEGSDDSINDSTGAAGKKNSINFRKAKRKLYLSLNYNSAESDLLVCKYNRYLQI